MHVGLYLFKNGGTFSKLQWWCRTTPRTCIDPLLHEFHNRQKQTVENLLGTPISTHQWTQAKLPTKFGGLGIIAPRTEIGLDIVSLADITFLAAHRHAVPHVQEHVPMIPEQILRACEGPSVQHLGACLPQLAPTFRDPAAFVNHRGVLEHLHHQVFGGLMQPVFPMCRSHPGVASPSLLSTAVSLPLSSTTPCAVLLLRTLLPRIGTLIWSANMLTCEHGASAKTLVSTVRVLEGTMATRANF